MIIISGIKLSLNQPKEDAIDIAIHKLKEYSSVNLNDIETTDIYRFSVAARRRPPSYVCSVAVKFYDDTKDIEFASIPGISIKGKVSPEIDFGNQKIVNRPIVVGFGPAGIFCSLLLAEHGFRPLILERGACLDDRVRTVNGYFSGDSIDRTTNVQFGEGGAGTFSDGKLTTRIGDPFVEYVIGKMVENGAPSDILYKAKPHVGTDHLLTVLKNIRSKIEFYGGEIRFLSQVDDFVFSDGKDRITGVTSQNELIYTDDCVLAIGHSARDTMELIQKKQIELIGKPFSVGLRIEHLQKDIDRGLYGEYAETAGLPVGEYQLSHRNKDGRGVYTFCMCPGGMVVAAESEPDSITVNGMSNYRRDGVNANAALVVSITPDDFGKGVLDGVSFQRLLEKRAYELGHEAAPVQLVGDYLAGKKSSDFERVLPTYPRGTNFADLNTLFPTYINEMLREGIKRFGRKLPGFDDKEAVLSGIETRTSSPVRILRDERYQALGIEGLYPCGEGAGYAGGIVSAAVDGLKVAREIMKKYRPFE